MDTKKPEKLKSPNYKIIYTDIILKKYPEKEKYCKDILSKEKFSGLDVMLINDIIFKDLSEDGCHKYRSYDKSTILEILLYQKTYHLNNIEVARHFKISRNSIAKWRKLFQ